MRFGRALLGAITATALIAPPAHAARPMQLGFTGTLPNEYGLAESVNSDIVRFDVYWSQIAPKARPKGFDATDPDDPAYDWTKLDAQVRNASAHGQQIIMAVYRAPKWAEGPHRPKAAAAGSWDPDAAAFGQFATAIATRYSGSHVDPLSPGQTLARVSYWQAWNEPNLALYLGPLWKKKSGNTYDEVGPGIYRSLVNAFYSSVKKVDATNTVLIAGLGPYGDPFEGGRRIMPVRYLNTLLCMNRRHKKVCSKQTKFDILDHHTYGVRGPFSHALNADDVSLPDIHKLQSVVKYGIRLKTVYPAKAKRTWITEVSWDSSPPDPNGVPEATQARWLSEAVFVFWRQHVDTVLWYQLRDSLPDPSYSTTYQSGVFFNDQSPKLSAKTFVFPFVVRKNGGAHVRFWGRSPADGTVMIEQKAKGGWTVVKQSVVRRHFVFYLRARGVPGTVYRARVGGFTSASYKAPS